MPGRKLHSLGWYDFVNVDRPDTANPVDMACEALIYTCVSGDEVWNRNAPVIINILAFLKEKTSKLATTQQLLELRRLLEKVPVPVDEVRNWFKAKY